MKSLRIHTIQHVPFEGLGSIEEWALDRGHTLCFTRMYEKPVFPAIADLDWLILLGGPMSVNDDAEISWLSAEKQFVRSVIAENKTVIGICLGAQLIASVLGSRVYPNPQKEIGWYPVKRLAAHKLLSAFPDELTVFHWHGETFELPAGSIHLFESEGCRNQGFLFREKVLGLQFHPEFTQAALNTAKTHIQSELTKGEYIQSLREIGENMLYADHTNKMLKIVLDKLAGSDV